jgi:hypothetical protein
MGGMSGRKTKVIDLRGWPEKEFFEAEDIRVIKNMPDGKTPPADTLPLPEGSFLVCFEAKAYYYRKECFIVDQSK